jgi:hypothetical protein
MPVRELLAGLGHVDLVRLGCRLQSRGQMLGGAADLVNLGKLAGDHVGHDMAGVETDPDLESGVPQACRRAGRARSPHGRPRGAWLSSAIGAPNTAASPSPSSLLTMPPNWRTAASHGREGRLQARDSLLRLQFGNKPGGVYDIGPKNRHKPTFAVGIGTLHALRPRNLEHQLSSGPIVRLTREAMHSRAFKGLQRPSSVDQNPRATLDKNTY